MASPRHDSYELDLVESGSSTKTQHTTITVEEKIDQHPLRHGKTRIFFNGLKSRFHRGDGKLNMPAATCLMLKASVGVGVMNLPNASNVLGLIPGIFYLLVIWAIATASGYMMGVIHKKHPDIGSFDDLATSLFGKYIGFVVGMFFRLFWISIAASAMFGNTIAINAVSDHATNTNTFLVCVAVAAFFAASYRNLQLLATFAFVGLIAIFVSVLYISVSVGVQASNSKVPSDYQLFGDSTPAEAFAAMSSIVFACSGPTANFGIISEMRDIRIYNTALWAAQIITLTVYMICGSLVYYFCGSHVTSPPFGSAGEYSKKIGYGIALLGLVASMVWLLSISARDIYRAWNHRSSDFDIHRPTCLFKWLVITFFSTAIATAIAGAVPTFDQLLSLLGAVFVPLFSFYLVPWKMICDRDPSEGPSAKWNFQRALMLTMMLFGAFVCIAGTYGSIDAIIQAVQDGVAKPFSSADTSITT